MPLYDYGCSDEKCNEKFEMRVSLTDVNAEKPVLCAKCGAEAKREILPLKAASTSWKHWRL